MLYNLSTMSRWFYYVPMFHYLSIIYSATLLRSSFLNLSNGD